MTGLPFVARWARNPMLRTAHMGDAVEYPAFPHVRAFFDTGRTYGTAGEDSPPECTCAAVMTPADRALQNALHERTCHMFDPQGED